MQIENQLFNERYTNKKKQKMIGKINRFEISTSKMMSTNNNKLTFDIE